MTMIKAIIGFVLGVIVLAPAPTVTAQQPKKISRIGYLSVGDPGSRGDRIEGLRDGLRELGYIEGKNIAIVYRFAGGRRDSLPDLARELVAEKVDVIFAAGTPATNAAKKATATLPIVTVSDDPVGRRLVDGLPRPGGNITGLSNLTVELVGKRLQLLKEVIPGLSRLALLCSPSTSTCRSRIEDTEVVAQPLGVQLQLAEIKHREELAPAFAAMKRDRAEALLTIRTPLIVNDLANQIVDLADKSRIPGMYDDRRFTRLGGLMSYGVNLADLDRLAAKFIDKILRGAKPADLPTEQPTKVELLINLKTAKALGLTIPAHLLMEAEMVIE
jgi:putative ABC transport system substrate-binding protein